MIQELFSADVALKVEEVFDFTKLKRLNAVYDSPKVGPEALERNIYQIDFNLNHQVWVH